MKVLVINAGSSSIKYQLYRMPEGEVLAKGVIERIGEERSLLSHTYDGRTHQRQMHVADHEKGMELLLDTLVSKEVGVIETISGPWMVPLNSATRSTSRLLAAVRSTRLSSNGWR